jgi:addiction module HigA family antidote
MNPKKLPPVHPGEVLLEEFLKPLDISQYRLAKDMSVPPRRVNEIVLRKRSVSADTALRLSRFFGTSAEFWLNLQSQYDLDVESDRLGKRLDAEVVQFAPRVELATRASAKALRSGNVKQRLPMQRSKRRPA